MNPEARKIILTEIAGKKVYRELVELNGLIGVKTAYDFLPWDILKIDSKILEDSEVAKLFLRGQLDHLL
jgi:hypothetical protein